MGKNVELSEDEMSIIDSLHKTGLSSRKIGKKIKRYHTTVDKYLKRGCQLKSKPRSGRPKAVNDHTKRLIWREASNSGVNCTKLMKDLSLPCSPRTTLRCLHENPNLEFKKMVTRPELTEQHKVARVAWCLERLLWNEEWHHMVFSDEKKFNLDGPDGWGYYWHDSRKKEKVFTKRQFGGGTVMIWAAFGYSGQSPIFFLDGNMNALGYVRLL